MTQSRTAAEPQTSNTFKTVCLCYLSILYAYSRKFTSNLTINAFCALVITLLRKVGTNVQRSPHEVRSDFCLASRGPFKYNLPWRKGYFGYPLPNPSPHTPITLWLAAPQNTLFTTSATPGTYPVTLCGFSSQCLRQLLAHLRFSQLLSEH